MATNNALNTSLSGQSGTGSFAGTNSPTFTGTSTLATLQFTNPATGGILGTTTNNNASAGYVGYMVQSTVLIGSAVSVTSAVAANVTSISLSAGDWLVWGNVATDPQVGATTTATASVWINTVSATAPTAPNAGARSLYQSPVSVGSALILPVGLIRIPLSAPTTVYLSGTIIFSGGTLSLYGYIGATIRR